ncbi:hypothetical protein LY90DRAFT_500624 [Neocallimastix californiae]|uniref:Subtilisin-like protein n=1 Tax=Neocallimastix californiae TaxID=1754190 RepID=A0A1Y2F6V9_9FUNG|nr:hypothetical protein LY90DRAFT_500624 [Neocallimastix californiae]|eukprot:ORY79611.1 hypothetical protein LY90DRAFT_500624 [Neocallimastix californiae]
MIFLLSLILMVLCHKLAYSKSLNDQGCLKSLCAQRTAVLSKNDYTKQYIIVYKSISNSNEKSKTNKFFMNTNELKNRIPFNHDFQNSINKRKRENPYSNHTLPKYSSFTKSFMFVNEEDLIQEVYGDLKEGLPIKRSEHEQREYTIKEFIKTINSTDLPIDYIEEDYPVYTDDISKDSFQTSVSPPPNENTDPSVVPKDSTNSMNETEALDEMMIENEIFGDAIETQKKNLGWGLDRIDQRQTTGDKTYKYPKQAGKNVIVYILDTGQASLVIKGLNWVIEDYTKNRKNSFGAIANVSLGSMQSRAINDAVALAKKNGILVITSAGNDGGDACSKSPASSNDG